jgi:hypothetical protein
VTVDPSTGSISPNGGRVATMSCWKCVDRMFVAAGCVGLLMPPQSVLAGKGRGPWQVATPVTRRGIDDVALTEGGTLRGLVTNERGSPVGGASVVISHGGREAAQTQSDATGRFVVRGLRGGVHQLATTGGSRLMRLWAAGSAPPSAGDSAQLVAAECVVRGQSTTRHRFSSDAVLLGAIVAVGAAIPLIIHGNRSDDRPGS